MIKDIPAHKSRWREEKEERERRADRALAALLIIFFSCMVTLTIVLELLVNNLMK